MYIEIEEQAKQPIQTRPNYRDNTKTDYSVYQNALLFVDGQKHPDKFDYCLYDGDNQQQASSIQPLPVGKYQLKESAFGVRHSFGVRHFNVDASMLEPLKQHQQPKVA